jgi:two-component system cell cycle sensor histidine kinase/response regulator CckA
MINLVVNSRDALLQGGRITIRTRNVRAADDCPAVRISVEDTGVGMSPTTQAQIFEPFFTTKGPRKGTGLGLSTAFGIVKQSGGYFEVDSKVGEGSSFHVILPGVVEAADKVVPPAAMPVRPRMSGQRKVLVIDDDLSLRRVICKSLEREGYAILPPTTPEEALAYVDQGGSFDLLLTDMVMPSISGPELAARLLSRDPEAKVLMMSGYLDDVFERFEAIRDQMHFLPKPFTASQLVEMIRVVWGEQPAGSAKRTPALG